MKLVPDEPTPLERLLLEASRAELPSEEHKARTRALLGIGVPLSGPLAAPSPTTTHVPAGAVASKGALLAKAAAAASVLAVVGAFVLSSGDEPASPAKAPSSVVKPALTEVAPNSAPPPVAVEALPAVSPPPPVEAPATLTPPRAARAPSPAASGGDLSEQIRLIEAARAGLSARNVKATNAALDAYSAQFPRGSFGQEAQVLRIRAVDQAGDAARATALAKAFIARFPGSPHVARLKPIAERGASR